MRTKEKPVAEIKPATLKNIAHGQVDRAFGGGISRIHANMMNMPDAEHEMTIKLKFYKKKDTGQWMVQPAIKMACKKGYGDSGAEVPIVVNEDGIFQSNQGKQMTLDSLEGEEE